MRAFHIFNANLFTRDSIKDMKGSPKKLNFDGKSVQEFTKGKGQNWINSVTVQVKALCLKYIEVLVPQENAILK